MVWSITSDARELLAHAGSWLAARPAEHTTVLSVAESLRSGVTYGEEPPLLGWWTDGGRVAGAFVHTPPHLLQLTAVPAGAATALAQRLTDRTVAGVGGDQRSADAFAQAWQGGHPGVIAAVTMRERLYRLGELVPPTTPGTARVAGPADRGLLVLWRINFNLDAFGYDDGRADRRVDDLLAYGGMTLWLVDDQPVSMASLTRPVAGMVRVGSVYTPPERRRHGYAGALVAHLSQTARDAGSTQVVLFTDLANPTSNSVYQRIGFRPVEDRVVIHLHNPT